MRRPRPKLTATRYILSVLKLLRKDVRFFLAATLAAVSLRLVFLLHFPGVVDDSRLYADIAMNWLQYGVYGITNSGHVMPTLSRLPGYPAFLAAIFTVFGWSNYRAVLLIQLLFDLGTCLLIADIARRILSDRAAKAAFMLAALCPFLANYSAAVLTETLEIFFTTLALDFAILGMARLRAETESQNSLRSHSNITPWFGCGLSIAACILLRPDGGILLAAIGAYLFLLLVSVVIKGKKPRQRGSRRSNSPRWNYSRHHFARSTDSMDAAKSAHTPSLRTAGSALRQRFGRARHERIQPLDQDLDRGVRIRRRNLLERTRRRD